MGKVFLDHDELPTSADLGSGIEAALNASDYLIAVSSPEYLQSKWCMKEVDTFIAQGKQDKILTVLVKGDPVDSFPPALRFVTNPDGTVTEVEPLAADVRAQDSRERNRKLKVENSLLAPACVGFDDCAAVTASVSSRCDAHCTIRCNRQRSFRNVRLQQCCDDFTAK